MPPRRSVSTTSVQAGARLLLGTTEELLDRVLRRDGVDRQTRTELEAGDLAQPWVDLPVPVVGRVDLFAEGRRVKHEVVRGTVEAGGESSEHLSESLGGGVDIRVGRPAEVRLVATRDDPDLERRARGVRGERDARVILPD